jgi:hypothetical protein
MYNLQNSHLLRSVEKPYAGDQVEDDIDGRPKEKVAEIGV